MVKPYSNDLRERAVAALAGGDSARVVGERFGIAKSSVIKWHQRYRKTGSIAPGKMGGHRKRIPALAACFCCKQASMASCAINHINIRC